MSKNAQTFIKLGLAIVFIWFGIDKIVGPDNWLGWMPDFVINIIPISIEQFIIVNGIIEIILGLALFHHKTYRYSAIIMSFFLMAVLVTFGFDQVTIRDIGLLFMALSLVVR